MSVTSTRICEEPIPEYEVYGDCVYSVYRYVCMHYENISNSYSIILAEPIDFFLL